MTVAFVLSGGGSLGAVQVGMLQALGDNDITPDLLIGTSAGAVNAAWVAAHGMSPSSLAGLGDTWSAVRRGDVFPLSPRQVMRGLLGLSTAVAPSSALRRLVSGHVSTQRLEDASIPVHLVSADLISGAAVVLSTGPLVDGVLASAAVPGVLEPVERDGRFLIDGGVASYAGVAQAVELGASTIYVLPAGAACALSEPPRSAVGVALHALSLLIQQRLEHEIAALQGAATIKLLPPLCPLAISAADFGHAPELIDRGRQSALRWIADGGLDVRAPERFLSTHSHSGSAPQATGGMKAGTGQRGANPARFETPTRLGGADEHSAQHS